AGFEVVAPGLEAPDLEIVAYIHGRTPVQAAPAILTPAVATTVIVAGIACWVADVAHATGPVVLRAAAALVGLLGQDGVGRRERRDGPRAEVDGQAVGAVAPGPGVGRLAADVEPLSGREPRDRDRHRRARGPGGGGVRQLPEGGVEQGQ